MSYPIIEANQEAASRCVFSLAKPYVSELVKASPGNYSEFGWSVRSHKVYRHEILCSNRVHNTALTVIYYACGSYPPYVWFERYTYRIRITFSFFKKRSHMYCTLTHV